ncbi:electron transfer flavoprotein subunit beta/FixA family protein [Desulfobotulus sp. H1]|uniref:Electron transfer flavoprotein subunit beta/FixA family protein n=1 Tax=Desulfobotulus pelophilus TaxID=2823377 RepID=A0ABT3NBI9_9BACT|nr:electron transfer flavoprotein subunit beta/FixA family protein [Desulfobotulus pelophilus]MCW7754829.1 electron transfer flavoprotein subunit beta/FixA family protein [Desulfobotulus pelophilus]
MNIIVCIKQVPDVTEVTWDENGSLIRTGLPSIINPNDKNALEAALTLKDSHGGTVTVMSMGPPQVEEALREALGMGCDRAILLTDRRFGGADCWATAYTLGLAIQKIADFDMVITGVEAMDGNTAQVGPELADYLKLPLCSYALNIRCEGGRVSVLQNMGDMVRELEAPLPCLITAEKELNEPRVAPMDMIMEAYAKEIEIWGMDVLGGDPANFGLKGSPTRLRKVFTPKRVKGQVEILEGDAEESARKLVEKLKEHNFI